MGHYTATFLAFDLPLLPATYLEEPYATEWLTKFEADYAVCSQPQAIAPQPPKPSKSVLQSLLRLLALQDLFVDWTRVMADLHSVLANLRAGHLVPQTAGFRVGLPGCAYLSCARF